CRSSPSASPRMPATKTARSGAERDAGGLEPILRAVTDVRELRELAEKRYDDFVEALREMVNVDCGSFTPDGVNAIADLCEARFERGGWEIERIRHEPSGDEERLGDLVIGRLGGSGTARVLMIGH